MALDRRHFLERGGLALAAAAVLGPDALATAEPVEAEPFAALSWPSVRSQFRLRSDRVHLGAFLLASHPASVRRAIERYRRALDADPVSYLHGSSVAREAAVLRAAAGYTGTRTADIALTDSTTMGLALLYNGIHVREGQELLTSTHDFFVTHDALQLKADRTGASLRKIRLYDDSAGASSDTIVGRVVNAVTPRTRVVALTWAHSSTGVKLPIRRIAHALRPLNRGRSEADRILLCVDGVHGFGVENVRLPALGCDFFAAGCHKWLFGSRGTGLVWGRPGAWRHVTHTIPSFTATGTPGGYDDARRSADGRVRHPSPGSASAHACTPCTLLRSGCAPFATGLALVARVKPVEIHDVLDGRRIAGVCPSEGFQRVPPGGSDHRHGPRVVLTDPRLFESIGTSWHLQESGWFRYVGS